MYENNSDPDVSNSSPRGLKTAITGDKLNENELKPYIYFKIPIVTGNGGSGTITFDITAENNSSKSTTQRISINYDNAKPEFVYTDEKKLTTNGGYIPINDTANLIVQSNKEFTIEGVVKDTGTGLSRVAVYFMREKFGTIGSDGYKPDRIYNPALSKNSVGNCTNIGDGKVNLVNGLPTYSPNVTYSEGALALDTPTDDVDLQNIYKNIRKGGLVLFDGVYRRITSVSNDYKVFVTPTVESFSEEKQAGFILALIVDNFTVESPVYNDAGELTKISNDDGDEVIESIIKSSSSSSNGAVTTEYDWSVSIDSLHIPDGSISINCVAFDNADNISDLLPVNTSVQNNRPAIANIWLGTDRDQSGEVEDNELQTKIRNVVLDTSDRLNYDPNWKKTASDLNLIDYTGKFSAVGKTVIMPEIIGGNGNLTYYYKKDSETSYTRLATEDATGVYAYAQNDTNGEKTTSVITLKLKEQNNTTTLDGLENGTHTLAFKLWDSTDSSIGSSETETNNTSQWAAFSVKFDVKVVDVIPPQATIKQFYWADKSNNSIYQERNSEGQNELKGHIELESDWKKSDGYKIWQDNDTKTEYDGDPKVSGIIRIQGTAKDETRLNEIAVSVDGFALAGQENSGYVTLARYKNGWEYYNGTGWGTTPVDALSSSGWKFSIDNGRGITSEGHEITWELDLDTSKISDSSGSGAGKDKMINIKVTDTGNNPAEGRLVDSSGNVSNTVGYKVDVVPYITSITTSLSSLKKNNPSIYARTALGHYPVAVTTSDSGTVSESIKIEGFNLTGGIVNFTKQSGTIGVAYNANGVTIPDAAKSGNVSITVNNVESLNNTNFNNSKGSYAYDVTSVTGSKTDYDNYYNRQPNGDNNNLLTDDVVVDIWELHSDAVVPISGNIEQPQMKINPKTGQLGFAFVNGPAYFSMPGKAQDTNYSYQYWSATFDFFTSVGLAYDKLGYSYAVAAGGDINTLANVNTADKYIFLSDRIGTAFKEGNIAYSTKQAENAIKIESVGMLGTKDNLNDSTYYFDKQRIKSSSLATAVHGTNTNVYLAYYDAMTYEIRFKYGTTGYTPEQSGQILGYDRTYSDIPFNATEYMKWYYHAVYKGEDSANRYRSYVLKQDAKSIVDIEGTEYEAQSWSKGSTGVSDSGTPNILILKDYSAEDMNDFTESVILAKLATKGYSSEEEAYASIMAAAATAYANGKQSDFWGLKTNNWNNNHEIKKLLEGISTRVVTITTRYAQKEFGNFKNTETSSPPQKYNTTTVSLIAGEGTGNNAGEYVSIGVVSGESATVDDVVVAVWYDAKDRVLKYSYNTTPTTDRAGKTNAEGWSSAITVFSGDMEKAGEYCQLAVDANGGIHIAAYDPVNCDLVYAYLASYNATPQTCVVDSSGVTGSNLTIDVAIDGDGNAVPRIGYYETSCIRPKIAYIADASISALAGTDNDAFTGKWEVSVVPTTKTVNMQSAQYNKINVAVWKTASGILTTSADGNFTAFDKTSANNSKTNTPNSFASTSNGFVYGNGTSNAVLGYAVKNGSNSTIETAQMK